MKFSTVFISMLAGATMLSGSAFSAELKFVTGATGADIDFAKQTFAASTSFGLPQAAPILTFT